MGIVIISTSDEFGRYTIVGSGDALSRSVAERKVLVQKCRQAQEALRKVVNQEVCLQNPRTTGSDSFEAEVVYPSGHVRLAWWVDEKAPPIFKGL